MNRVFITFIGIAALISCEEIPGNSPVPQAYQMEGALYVNGDTIQFENMGFQVSGGDPVSTLSYVWMTKDDQWLTLSSLSNDVGNFQTLNVDTLIPNSAIFLFRGHSLSDTSVHYTSVKIQTQSPLNFVNFTAVSIDHLEGDFQHQIAISDKNGKIGETMATGYFNFIEQ